MVFLRKRILSGLAGLILIPGLHAQPVITSQPANQMAVWGSNAVFSVGVTGTGPFTYQWQLNGTNLPNNVITTFAGGQLFDGQMATNTILNSALGATKDGAGNLYITDTRNHIIRRMDTNGLAKIVCGIGYASYSGDGGAATNAGLNQPAAVILDPLGNLLIADSGNNRIRKIDTNGIITTVAGNGFGLDPNTGSIRDNLAATNGTISGPSSLCLDPVGNLYIADTFNHRLRKVGTNGIITTAAGTSQGYGGDGTAANSSGVKFSLPTSVVIDAATNIYIADSGNNRIRKINAAGIISTAAGNGTAGYLGDGGAPTAARLRQPAGVALDASRNLFIADTGNNVIRKAGTNNIITTVAGNGTNGFLGDGSAATNAALSIPQNISVDANRNLLIGDYGNSRIRQVDTNGIITTVAGCGLNDGASATNATLNAATGVAFDAVGNMYVSDYGNNRIRKIDTNGIITTVAGNGIPGYSGDGISATLLGLNRPAAVTVDANGNLYVCDNGDFRIRKMDASGILTTIAGNGSFGLSSSGGATNVAIGSSFGVAVDTNGNVFFSDSTGSVRKVDPIGNISVIDNDLGSIPYGTALDSAGNLLATYIGQNVIHKISPAKIVQTVAGNGSYGFSGDGGPAVSAAMSNPQGVAVDAIGNIFVSDAGNGRIRKINTNNIISTIAGNGIYGYSGDGGPALNAALSDPFGMALDTSGNVYFADPGNNRIRKLSYVDYADLPTLTITNVTPGSLSNNYSVIVSSSAGSVTSSVATVFLQLPPITPFYNTSNQTLNLVWPAVSNLIYQLQYTPDLSSGSWINLGSPITATNGLILTGDNRNLAGQGFYRVHLVP